MFSGTTWIIVAIPKIPIGLTAARRICFFETYSKHLLGGYGKKTTSTHPLTPGASTNPVICRGAVMSVLTAGS